MKRTIIFGDIHGCYDEWRQLLKRVKASENDQLIAVGDLIFKGPHSAKCLDLAMSLPNFQSVLGNHDHYFLKNYSKDSIKQKKHEHAAITEEFGEKSNKYWNYISKWPLFIETDNYAVVHAGIRPGLSLDQQEKKDLLFLRELEDKKTPWHEHYKKNKLIVYGHWARQGLKIKSNSIGLDTGCVYGKQLSALILPSREIVSVQAKKVYCPIAQ